MCWPSRKWTHRSANPLHRTLLWACTQAPEHTAKAAPPVGWSRDAALNPALVRMDADDDGRVTKAEYDKVAYKAPSFDVADLDHDGVLAVRELAALVTGQDPVTLDAPGGATRLISTTNRSGPYSARRSRARRPAAYSRFTRPPPFTTRWRKAMNARCWIASGFYPGGAEGRSGAAAAVYAAPRRRSALRGCPAFCSPRSTGRPERSRRARTG